MSLAKASAALQKKDGEKTAAVQEVQKLKDLQSDGFSGNLKFSVFQIDGLKSPFVESDFVIDYVITPGDQYQSEEGLTKSVNDSTTVLLKSKEVRLEFTCRLSDAKATSDSLEVDAASLRFMTTIAVTDILDDKEFRQELVARPVAVDLDAELSNSKIVIHFKALYDRVGTLLASKNLELEEIEKELKEIAEQLKEAKKKTTKGATIAKGKDKKKKSAKKNTDSTSTIEEYDDAAAGGSSLHQQIIGVAMMLPGLVIENRAAVMFGVASLGVFLYGDLVSV